ncbi:MAG TPA: UvrD-helicase domain-containing protein [Trueperaceae bacterium]
MRVRVASAGTGKTTSLVLRYLELIATGTPLRRIAGVTFTRTAAAELRQRVGAGLEAVLESGGYLHLAPGQQNRQAFEEARRELDGATLTTIHGFMIGALRLAAPTMGLDPEFNPVAEWEGEALFEEELRSLLLLASDPGHPLHLTAERLGRSAGSDLLDLFRKRSLVDRFEAGSDERSEAAVELFEAAYEAYEKRLGATMLAPGEVERRALAMTRVPRAMERLRDRYRVVLVDEFQDVNPVQGRYFEAVEASGIEVEVVGDPKQSIYGFRNADVGVFRRALANGEELPPLVSSYRHGELVNRFLNKLTATLGEREMGFSAREAPSIGGAGEATSVRGRIEMHWVVGDEPVAELRCSEAKVLAERLSALHHDLEIPYREMAVLARSHPSLAVIEAALEEAGVPAILLQGRGYFERREIRDLYNALRAGVEPSGVPFAAWLRGPFGGLSANDFEAVLAAPEPLARLRLVNPAAAQRYDRLREIVLLPPLEALKALVREPLIDGLSLVSFLTERQRENVDALLFTVAGQPPASLEVLLERLDLLGRQSDAGDVPQTGEGIELLTVHAAKGLEWRVAAIFDLGRGAPPNRDSLRVDPESGRVAHRGSPEFDLAGSKIARREEAESYRLLYVAASRPREILLLTGSARGGRAKGWAKVLELMSLGPGARPRETAGFRLGVHRVRAEASRSTGRPGSGSSAPVRESAPWLDDTFPTHPYPPVFSPSRLKTVQRGSPLASTRRGAGRPADEPLEPADRRREGVVEPAEMRLRREGVVEHPHGGEGLPNEPGEPIRPGEAEEYLPGRASAVGTLVHYAISQSWRPDDPQHLENLLAQEVMFPFSRPEQESMLGEVAELLANYWSLVGAALPELEAREVDEAELPIALPHGATVWQGVIDRLYRIDGRWHLDDYKTDRIVDPGLYLAQLAIYRRAVKEARGVEPLARLVYLRSGEVVDIGADQLESAFEAAMSRDDESGSRPRD